MLVKIRKNVRMTPGKWLFYVTVPYLILALMDIFVWGIDIVWFEICWVLILALPIYLPSLANWVGIEPIWGKNNR